MKVVSKKPTAVFSIFYFKAISSREFKPTPLLFTFHRFSRAEAPHTIIYFNATYYYSVALFFTISTLLKQFSISHKIIPT